MRLLSCCGSLVEHQFIESRKAAPSQKQIEGRCCSLLPLSFWQSFIYHRPQAFGFFLPLAWTLCWWLPVMTISGSFSNYFEPNDSIDAKVGWPFALMMLFGSLVAGGTSEGGGAVAYPVMTLVFGLTSYVARDFSLMIQSVGMTAAAFSILYSQIKVEKRSIIVCNLGGAIGTILGILFVAPYVTGDIAKMLFVGVWSTFAFALYLLNRNDDRPVFLEIQAYNKKKRNILFLVGFVGGIFTSIAGSGVDIMSFSALTLIFRVSEKTATPTSVVLMGCNTVVGFLTQLILAPYILSDDLQQKMLPQDNVLCNSPWHGGCIAAQTWYYFLCAAIVVPCGAPLGAYLASFLKRFVYAYIVYCFNAFQLIMAFFIVKQTMDTIAVFSSAVFLACITFYIFFKTGEKMLHEALELGCTPFFEKRKGTEDLAQKKDLEKNVVEKMRTKDIEKVGQLFFKTENIFSKEELMQLNKFRNDYRKWRLKQQQGAKGQLAGPSSQIKGNFSSHSFQGEVNDDICCICLGELKCPVLLSCRGNHVFCYQCLNRADESNIDTKCPLCRTPVLSLNPLMNQLDLPLMIRKKEVV